MPYRGICDAVRVPYPSLVRWRMRRDKDAPLVRQPGPQKVKPPDLDRINRDIAELSHGQDRTQGTGALYTRHGSSISRRELTSMVALARHDLNKAHRQNLRRIRWNVPNVAWSMDPCEYRQQEEAKVYLNQMQDLASRYKFAPITGEIPCGEEIAGHLAATFKRFGPPLFLRVYRRPWSSRGSVLQGIGHGLERPALPFVVGLPGHAELFCAFLGRYPGAPYREDHRRPLAGKLIVPRFAHRHAPFRLGFLRLARFA